VSAPPAQHHTFSRHQRVLAGFGLAGTALVVSACGGSGSISSSHTADPAVTAGNVGSVSGKVVSVSGSSAQIQSTSGTISVAFGSSTRLSKVSTVSLASLAKGDCVVVTNASGPASASASVVTARTVSVTGATACTQGFGGRGGFGGGGGAPPGGGFGSASPNAGGGSGFPRPVPSGSPGFRGGFRGGFGGRSGGPSIGADFGTVASVSTSSFVMTSQRGVRTVTVKTTPSTTISATATATSSALATGSCASAFGVRSSDGTIDARMITISAPTNGKCTTLAGLPGARGFTGVGPGFGASPGASNA
jgi:hypothetical protein